MNPESIQKVFRLCQSALDGMNPVTLQKTTDISSATEHAMSDSTVNQYQTVRWGVTG